MPSFSWRSGELAENAVSVAGKPAVRRFPAHFGKFTGCGRTLGTHDATLHPERDPARRGDGRGTASAGSSSRRHSGSCSRCRRWWHLVVTCVTMHPHRSTSVGHAVAGRGDRGHDADTARHRRHRRDRRHRRRRAHTATAPTAATPTAVVSGTWSVDTRSASSAMRTPRHVRRLPGRGRAVGNRVDPAVGAPSGDGHDHVRRHDASPQRRSKPLTAITTNDSRRDDNVQDALRDRHVPDRDVHPDQPIDLGDAVNTGAAKTVQATGT